MAASASSVPGLAGSRVRSAGSFHGGKSCKHSKWLRIGTLNIGTLKGKTSEVVETVTRRRIDLCCLQETRWKGGLVPTQNRMLTGKDSCYKLFWAGNKEGSGGVGILLAERWVPNVFEVARVSDRIILLKLAIGTDIYTFLSVYAPQVGLSDASKDNFYDDLRQVVAKLPPSEIPILLGDWNGHVGSASAGYEGVHGGHGWGTRNAEGERVLEFAESCGMLVGNTCFQKRPSHLITYTSGGASTQIDYVLLKRSFRKWVRDVKVIPGEEIAPQHHLLVCDFRADIPPMPKKNFSPRLRSWRLNDPEAQSEFHEAFIAEISTDTASSGATEEIWGKLKSSLLKVAEGVCGFTKKHRWRKETWWWNSTVDCAVKEKRRCWKAWKKGGSKEDYQKAKRLAKHAVYLAKSQAEQVALKDPSPSSSDLFRLAKQMRRANRDVQGEKPVRNDAGKLCLDDKAMQDAWREHYERLSNVEFEWDPESLTEVHPVEGPAPYISLEQVLKAIKSMKCGKAAGTSLIIAEMLKASGVEGAQLIRDLIEAIIHYGKIPTDWEESIIVSLYKGKGVAIERGNYRGLKLLEQVMKVLERVAESILRQQVHINDMQFGFMPGRGTTDAIFIVRQLQEKFLAANKPLYMAFVDLEKAFDRVPRRVIWWALRKLGVEEWLVLLIQSMYDNARSRVRVGRNLSDEFSVRVGVHQGSCLSPLLFITVLEALSQEFRTGCPWEDLYADDLVIISDSLEELQAKLALWKTGMEAKGLRVNMGKTKIMISGPGLNVLQKTGKHPCAVCLRGVGTNSILCTGCSCWVHKKCSGITGILLPDPTFRCNRCSGLARPIDSRPMTEVTVGTERLEVVPSFCYLGDTLSSGGGCELASITRCRTAWGKFNELLPILTSRSIPITSRGLVYNSCVRSIMLYASETWAPTSSVLHRLQRNDRAMIRWMCGVTTKDQASSQDLLGRLQLDDIVKVLRTRRLRWHGHIERSNGWLRRVQDIDPGGGRSRGRPNKTWAEVVRADQLALGMAETHPSDRTAWSGTLRSAVRLDPPLLQGLN